MKSISSSSLISVNDYNPKNNSLSIPDEKVVNIRKRVLPNGVVIVDTKTSPTKSPDPVAKASIVVGDDGSIRIKLPPGLPEGHYIYRFKCTQDVEFDKEGKAVNPPAARNLFSAAAIKNDAEIRRGSKLERYYFGSVFCTENNDVYKRFQTYNFKINTRDPASHIIYALRKNPEFFDLELVRVLDKNTPEKEVHEIEAQCIEKYATMARPGGFNHSDPRKERLRANISRTPPPKIREYETRSKTQTEEPEQLESFERTPKKLKTKE